jgi:hypothetical protein
MALKTAVASRNSTFDGRKVEECFFALFTGSFELLLFRELDGVALCHSSANPMGHHSPSSSIECLLKLRLVPIIWHKNLFGIHTPGCNVLLRRTILSPGTSCFTISAPPSIDEIYTEKV